MKKKTRLPECGLYLGSGIYEHAGKLVCSGIAFKNPRRCILHQFGDVDPIELAPAEFRILDTVVLKPGEKINQE